MAAVEPEVKMLLVDETVTVRVLVLPLLYVELEIEALDEVQP